MSVTLSPWPESSARLLGGVTARPTPSGSSTGKGRADGPKRLKISLLGSAPKPQLAEGPALRATLEGAIRTVLNSNKEQTLNISLTQIFAACHLYVSGGSGMALATIVRDQLSNACTKLAREIVADKDAHSSVWLSDFTSRWSNFYDHQVATLSSMLAYLDRGYLLPNSESSIRQQALDLAKSTIFKLPAVVKRILEAVENWARTEREIATLRAVGKADSSRPEDIRPPVVQLVRVLTLLGYYEEFFEEPYIRNARSFYKARSETFYKELKKSPQEFLEHWAQLAEAEEERARAVLQQGSWAAAERASEDAFVGERVKWLAEDGLRLLFAQRSDNGDIAVDTLRNLYDILLRTEGRDLLRAEWSAYLTREVKTIVEGDAAVMIDGLLELHGFAGRVVRDAFRELNSAGSRRDVFSHGLDDAFERGFQPRGKEVAVQIAKYIDTKLRSSTKTLSEDARDALLDSVLLLFRYTADKDVFRTFYTRALARRLLRGNTADNDAEKRVLQKLMREYDPDFEKGLEMFKDLELSQELLDGFMEKMQFRGLDADASKMTAMVLQTTAWPIHGVVTIQLPEEMLKVLSEYERFYKSKHNGRAITWHHEQGFAVVNAWFPKRDGPYNLHVSLFQAVVLELFNDSESLTFQEILDQTKLEKEELKRALNSLSAKQHRILVKRPPKDIDYDTVFSINNSFEHPRVKVTVNQIVPPAAEAADDKRAHAEVDGFRINAIDSAIVRHMKQHKTCTHSALELAVMDSTLKFKPTTKFVKERIGWLMANEYMTRDEEDHKIYHYVA